MVALYFVPSKLPRTWTKAQWKEAWRYKRVMEKVLAAEMEKKREFITEQMANLAVYGTTHPMYGILQREIDLMISPALLLGPGMEP